MWFSNKFSWIYGRRFEAFCSIIAMQMQPRHAGIHFPITSSHLQEQRSFVRFRIFKSISVLSKPDTWRYSHTLDGPITMLRNNWTNPPNNLFCDLRLFPIPRVIPFYQHLIVLNIVFLFLLIYTIIIISLFIASTNFHRSFPRTAVKTGSKKTQYDHLCGFSTHDMQPRSCLFRIRLFRVFERMQSIYKHIK